MRVRKACDVARRAAVQMQQSDAQLVTAEEPQFMSLVGKPSNRTGFKTIRSEADSGSLLSITLPTGISRGEAEAYMDAFDLGADYELVESMEGLFVLTKRGAGQVKNSVSVDMGGIVATISRSAFSVATRSMDEEPNGVAVSAIRFSKSKFSRTQAEAFLAEFADDCKLADNLESTEYYTVQRGEAYELPKTFEYEDGVTVYLVRSEENDVPVKMYRNVMEQAYGNFGMGHIDFTAAMADPDFSEKSWDAIYYLQDVLENVILYSELSLEERKILMQNALASFSSYMNGLMDSLPTSVIEQVRSEMQKQESVMNTENLEQKASEEVVEVAVEEAVREEVSETAAEPETEEAVREEGQAVEGEEAVSEEEATEEVVEAEREEEAPVEESESVTMTREELEALIAAKVAEATAPVAEETESQVERSEEESTEGTGEVATRSDESKDADTPANEMEVMMSAMRSMAEQVTALTSTVAELTGNSVVVRSSEQNEELTVGEEAKREDAPRDVFAGAIFGNR